MSLEQDRCLPRMQRPARSTVMVSAHLLPELVGTVSYRAGAPSQPAAAEPLAEHFVFHGCQLQLAVFLVSPMDPKTFKQITCTKCSA